MKRRVIVMALVTATLLAGTGASYVIAAKKPKPINLI